MLNKIVFWSAGDIAEKTKLAVKHAQKLGAKTLLADFKEVIPDIYRYLSVPYNSKQDLIPVLEGKKENPYKFLEKKGGLFIFTGFNKEDSIMYTPKHMFSLIDYFGSAGFENAVFEVNGGICWAGTYAALKSADEIYVVMQSDNLSYYMTAELSKFVSVQWGVNHDAMTGIVVGKRCDIETVKSITGFKNIVRVKSV